MASSAYRIESLTKDNYDTWCLQAQAVLVKNELWDYISGEKLSTATSTAEAEYMPLSDSVKEAIHLRMLLNDIAVTKQEKMVIFSDNKAAIEISKNDIVTNKTKHIDIRIYFLREHVRNRTIDIKYLETEKMEADIFTKGLPGPRYTE